MASTAASAGKNSEPQQNVGLEETDVQANAAGVSKVPESRPGKIGRAHV